MGGTVRSLHLSFNASKRYVAGYDRPGWYGAMETTCLAVAASLAST